MSAEANTWTLEERIWNLEFQDRGQEPQPYINQEQEGNIEKGSSRGGPRRSFCRRTQIPIDA